MKQILLYIILAIFAIPIASGETLQDVVDSFIKNKSLAYSSTGVSIVDIETGKELAGSNSFTANIPASILKTLTCATAREILGRDFTFDTNVKLVGRKDEKGIFRGEMIIDGGYDPTLGSGNFKNHPNIINAIAKALNDLFIIKFEGRIKVTPECDEIKNVNPRWDCEDIVWDYGATSFAFNYHDNFVNIPIVIAGDGVKVDSCANNCGGLNIINHSYLARRRGRFEPVMIRSIGSSDIVFRGAVKKPKKDMRLNYYCSLPNPDTYFAQALKEALKKNYIEYVDADSKIESADTLNLLTFSSPSIDEIIKVTLDESQNMYAETLFMAIGRKEKSDNDDIDYSCDAIRKHWKHKGLNTDQLFIYDGSGLARRNKVSAGFITQMLCRAYKDMNDFPKFLPKAGEEGTVKSLMSKTDYSGKFCLKSGSMSDAQSFAGYYPADSPKYAITIIVNNFTGQRKKLISQIEDFLVNLVKIKVDK